jgi:hypothetical protein
MNDPFDVAPGAGPINLLCLYSGIGDIEEDDDAEEGDGGG